MSVDRTRRFDLPGIQDLNKDQDEALARPMDGQHLVIGGPGTGKSVVALLKARRLGEKNKLYGALVYNHLLYHSNRHLFGKENVFPAGTWDRWFRRLYGRIFGSDIPTLEPKKLGGYSPINWAAVKERIKKLSEDLDHSDKYIVIDEGQDIPPPFYEALTNLGFENFYVVADQNQQIHADSCSSRRDIEDSLGIESCDVLELTTNYRNTHSIAALASHFYPDDKSSPPVNSPEPSLSAVAPELLTYGTEDTATLDAVASNILQLCDRNPRKLVGVIVPNNRVREKFNQALHQANPTLDNEKPPIQTFASGQNDAPDFGSGGILVINAQSCKGLEFDTVILADIDSHQPKQRDSYVLKSRFYVMVSRARDQVIMLRTGPQCHYVEALLPKIDNPILVRK